MNREQKRFIAGELVKVAKDLMAEEKTARSFSKNVVHDFVKDLFRYSKSMDSALRGLRRLVSEETQARGLNEHRDIVERIERLDNNLDVIDEMIYQVSELSKRLK
jgi:hypothetical protein